MRKHRFINEMEQKRFELSLRDHSHRKLIMMLTDIGLQLVSKHGKLLTGTRKSISQYLQQVQNKYGNQAWLQLGILHEFQDRKDWQPNDQDTVKFTLKDLIEAPVNPLFLEKFRQPEPFGWATAQIMMEVFQFQQIKPTTED